MRPRQRHVVVAPIFNHDRTVGGVLAALEEYGVSIIVVNDGSTDGTAAVLERWLNDTGVAPDGLKHVLTHTTNKGKAAALRTGFAYAAQLGFTHAATIDTDGQHDPADLRGLLGVSDAHPDGLVIGARVRQGSHAPFASRIGRAVSNWLVWIESGVLVTDSQSGMRVYPLSQMSALSGVASRYGFETEVLARAGWLGVPVIESPIRCIYKVPGGRTTHFRLGSDTFASVRMHARLLARAHLPGPARASAPGPVTTGTIPGRLARWFSPRRLRRMAQGDSEARERLAASIGVGLLMATLPVYGIKTVACLWASNRFRLHPLAVIGTSSLSTPPLGLAFAAVSILCGGLVLHGELPDLSGISLEQAMQWTTVNALLAEWLIGSVIAGVALGLSGYLLLRALLAVLTPRAQARTAPEIP